MANSGGKYDVDTIADVLRKLVNMSDEDREHVFSTLRRERLVAGIADSSPDTSLKVRAAVAAALARSDNVDDQIRELAEHVMRFREH
jgi:hypothetical protein